MVVHGYADNPYERNASVVDWKCIAIGFLTIAGASVHSFPRYDGSRRSIAGGRC